MFIRFFFKDQKEGGSHESRAVDRRTVLKCKVFFVITRICRTGKEIMVEEKGTAGKMSMAYSETCITSSHLDSLKEDDQSELFVISREFYWVGLIFPEWVLRIDEEGKEVIFVIYGGIGLSGAIFGS